jgi:hypothetical protein
MSIGKLPAPADVIPFEVWSGGQTGVDRGALEGAQGTGLPTGGFAPKDWITEKGPAPELGTKFGLKSATRTAIRHALGRTFFTAMSRC